MFGSKLFIASQMLEAHDFRCNAEEQAFHPKGTVSSKEEMV